MKKIVLLIITFLTLVHGLKAQLTTEQWQEDLHFLQKTIHDEYASLFVKTTPTDFDAAVESLHAQIPDMEPHEIIVGMSRIIALFRYGHTDISFNQKPYDFRYLPINLYIFGDEIRIQGTEKKYESAVGAKVLAINTIPISEAVERIRPVVNSENEQYFKAYGINYLRIPEVLHAQGIIQNLDKGIDFTLEKNGTVFTVTFSALPKGAYVPTTRGYVFQDENWVSARKKDSLPRYLKKLDRVYYSEYLPKEKALYVRHSRIQDDTEESTADFYNRVFDFVENNEVERLIIDVRLNGGGNNYLNRKVITGIVETKKINQVGKLFVLLGRRTFSACQNLVNEMDNYTNAIFLGEPTAENINFWGDARPVALPNSTIPVYLSFAWWQDKPVWENAEWLAPTMKIEPSFQQYVDNRDPVLQAALSFDAQGFQPNPMQYVTDLYSAGKTEELATELPKMIHDPRYGFVDFETELSKKGQLLLNSGRTREVQASVQVFHMIAQLFPDSARAWKNVGAAYARTGAVDEATSFLEKAMTMDDGAIAVEARQLLKELK